MSGESLFDATPTPPQPQLRRAARPARRRLSDVAQRAEAEGRPSRIIHAEMPSDLRDYFAAVQELIAQRLAGTLDYDGFARESLRLHQQYNRPGYDSGQLLQDLAESKTRQERAARRRAKAEADRRQRRLEFVDPPRA
jgi:hypothetical protein